VIAADNSAHKKSHQTKLRYCSEHYQLEIKSFAGIAIRLGGVKDLIFTKIKASVTL
jgi:hypothetical protein